MTTSWLTTKWRRRSEKAAEYGAETLYPVHAYDYDEITGHQLTARRAAAGENLHTLDDTSRIAKGDELVIADAEHPAGLEDLVSQIQAGEMKTLNIIVKADVQGSAEAVKASLEKITNEEVRVKVTSCPTG